MSTPSPLQPQGTLDRANAPRSRVRITVLTILALHVVFIGGLLLQGGCNKSSPNAGSSTANASSNGVPSLPGLTDPNTNSFYTSFPGDTAGNPATNHGASAAPGLAGAGAVPPAGGAGVPSAVAADPNASGAGGVGGFAPPANNNNAFAAPSFGNPAGTTATSPAPGAATEHVIKSGDTVRDLAKKYGVSEKAILEANPALNPRRLKVEAKITIPAPVAAVANPSTHGGFVANEAAAGGEQYIVKPGDTLAKIAKKYGVTVKQIMAANGMKNDRIVPKQKLTIPAKATAAAPAPAASRPAGATTTF